MDTGAENEVDLAAGRLTALLERHLPHLLDSLSLVGSAADGDFRPGRSDLDFVAVMSRPPTSDELEGLGIVHRLYAGDPTLPTLDGIWIAPADLAAGPDAAAPGPATRDGVFLALAAGNRNPVTWFTLRDRSRTILGELDRNAIWHDQERLVAWTRENVEQYWAPWLLKSSRLTNGRGLAMLGRWAPMWGVLGICRMHATVATGSILSKSEAGERALTVFDAQWLPILEECLSIRRGGHLSMSPWRRRRQALSFVGMALAAVRAL